MSQRTSSRSQRSASPEAILAVLAGLTIAGCEKKNEAQPEQPAAPADSAAAPAQAPAAAGEAKVEAKEVPSAAPAPGAQKSKEKAAKCTSGGCAPGKCGGNE